MPLHDAALTLAGELRITLMATQPAPIPETLRTVAEAFDRFVLAVGNAERQGTAAVGDSTIHRDDRARRQAAAYRTMRQAARELQQALVTHTLTLRALCHDKEMKVRGASLARCMGYVGHLQGISEEVYAGATEAWIRHRLPYTATDHLPGADLLLCE